MDDNTERCKKEGCLSWPVAGTGYCTNPEHQALAGGNPGKKKATAKKATAKKATAAKPEPAKKKVAKKKVAKKKVAKKKVAKKKAAAVKPEPAKKKVAKKKAATRKKVAKKKATRTGTVVRSVIDVLGRAKVPSDAAIIAEIKKSHPQSKFNDYHVRWYKSRYRAGKLPGQEVGRHEIAQGTAAATRKKVAKKKAPAKKKVAKKSARKKK
jgi:hypothetical protein